MDQLRPASDEDGGGRASGDTDAIVREKKTVSHKRDLESPNSEIDKRAVREEIGRIQSSKRAKAVSVSFGGRSAGRKASL